MKKTTHLFQCHEDLHAKITNFSGYLMPLHYGSPIHEYTAVRERAGMFDVSHMMITDIQGTDALHFLNHLTPNNLETLPEKKGCYTCLLNDKSGIVDDVIVYKMNRTYRLISNAATCENVRAFLHQYATHFSVELHEQNTLSMLALQGPDGIDILNKILNISIDYPRFAWDYFQNMQIARTGYTGSDGVEIIAPHTTIISLWKQLLDQRVQPCGLSARDILRIEAGLLLYGQDMTEKTTPHECGLLWLVDQRKQKFLGKKALINHTPTHQLHYATCPKGRLPRTGQLLYNEKKQHVGIVTSSTFSPKLQKTLLIVRLTLHTHGSLYAHIGSSTLILTLHKKPWFKKNQFETQNNETP